MQYGKALVPMRVVNNVVVEIVSMTFQCLLIRFCFQGISLFVVCFFLFAVGLLTTMGHFTLIPIPQICPTGIDSS